jgi:sugar lactone lactonase YvrE
MRRALLVLVGLMVFGLGVLTLLPSPIDAVAYAPPPAPVLRGPLAPNELLRAAELLAEGRIHGPEDVAVDAQGRLYAATADRSGLIQRLDADGTPRDFATTGGRPLGLRFSPGGNPALPGAGGTSLIVCDSSRGLLSVDPEGHVSVLATEAEGVPFRFTNNLDVAHDGIVYFSDSSTRFGQAGYLYDLFEARPSGRLLRYDPAAGTATVLLRDLYFANGVALSSDESFVLVNETYRYRTTRYWLKGPKRGTSDIFLDNLPGFPDNLDGNRKGSFWMALFTVRNKVADTLHPYPWAKTLMAKLPRFVWPRPEPYGFVLEIDETGRILRSLQDPGGQRVRHVTTAREHDGKLYLGSLDQAWIGRLALQSPVMR